MVGNTDAMDRISAFILLIFIILFTPLSRGQTGPIYITEFLVTNQTGLTDDDGDYSGWIELYNASRNPVNLSGWSLTSDPQNLQEWPFPEVSIGSDEFLVLYASGKNRVLPETPLHTSFVLNPNGGFLALVKPGAEGIASQVQYPSQIPDVSYGFPTEYQTRSLLEPGALGKLRVPADDSLGQTWIQGALNDDSWIQATNGIGFELDLPAQPFVVADSVNDFSGTQGKNNWRYGYYVRTLDLDGAYQATNFVAFPNAEGPFSANNFFDGTVWRWYPNPTPWDTLAPDSAHPNSPNDPYLSITPNNPGGEVGGYFPDVTQPGGQEHWVIRRWECATTGKLRITFRLAKGSMGGDGVTGLIYQNDQLLFSRSIAQRDPFGYRAIVEVTNARPGDLFDFILSPAGRNTLDPTSTNNMAVIDTEAPSYNGSIHPWPTDQYDTSLMTAHIETVPSVKSDFATDVSGIMHGKNASIYVRYPFPAEDLQSFNQLKLLTKFDDGFVAYLNGTRVAARHTPALAFAGKVADSVADFSGTQGLKSWYYGYYNQSKDTDKYYSAAEFIPFPRSDGPYGPDNFWKGSTWDWYEGNPPWDEITPQGWHPNSGGNVDKGGGIHWVIRRWRSTVTGTLEASVFVKKTNPNCGDGITLHTIHNGKIVDSITITAQDTNGVTKVIRFPVVDEGDFLDFALSPGGINGYPEDTCDSTLTTVTINQLSSTVGLSWNSASTAENPNEEARNYFEVDLTSQMDLIQESSNLLAIQGLNVSADDRDFLLVSELRGRSTWVGTDLPNYLKPTPRQLNIISTEAPFKIINLTVTGPNSATLEWESIPEKDYSVYFTPFLEFPDWQLLYTDKAQGSVMQFETEISGPGFYRVLRN